MDTALIGRDDELARLRGLVDPPPAEGRVLILLGDVGMGKTALLADAAGQARRAGLRVLSVTGVESEQDLAFAGLHQLLRPVLGRVEDLPDRQAKALLGALALSADPVPPDALLTGIAVLTLFSDLSEEGPLLVMADDIQWLDRGSLGTLAFVARRLEAEPVVLLLAARGTVPPAGFERDLPELTLEPLSTKDAARLLDAQPQPPRGRAREQVLTQAAGNPMALIELSRVIAADPSAGRRWAAEPLPPTERLAAIIAAEFDALPAPARDALLLAAVADTADLTALGMPGLTADALAPSEAAGLIRVDTSGPHFNHPLVRSAIYHTVPFAERAAAHRRIADALRDQPDRYAWHLAAAALGPDEQVASLLEKTAAQAQRRGGLAAAARALERAAELSPRADDQARRLLAAAALAVPTGQADWVQELAARVLSVTADPELRTVARLRSGWALAWSNRHADALATLLSVAAEASASSAELTWDALGLAATVAYQTGARADRDAVVSAFGRLEEQGAGRGGEAGVWLRASMEPFGDRAEVVAYLRQTARGAPAEIATLGAAAWVLDETELAVTLLREALGRLRAAGVGGRSGAALSALEWACIDSGRWDDALAAAREACDAAAAYTLETVAASADLATATVFAMRGNYDQVRPHLDSALAAVNPAEYRGFAVRAHHAAGLAALAEGDYITAHAQLGQLFGGDGTPLHHHVSYLGIADYAAAAVRGAFPRGPDRGRTRHGPGGSGPGPAAGAACGPRPRPARRACGRRGSLRGRPVPSGRRGLAVRTGPAPAGLRGMAAPTTPDQRGQTGPGHGARGVPPPRRRTVGPARRGRTARQRRDRAGRAYGAGRARRAHPAAARDRDPGQPGPDQRRDRRPAVPVSPHRRVPPVPLLSQARHRGPPPATRPGRPSQDVSVDGPRTGCGWPGSARRRWPPARPLRWCRPGP